MAIDVADTTVAPQTVMERRIEPVEKMRVLDLSAELLQYRFARKQLQKKEFVHRFLPTLQARSTLGTSPGEVPPIPAPVPPDAGHLPGKFSAGSGYRGDDSFLELGWRPAYHDLFDPDGGYIEGAQINFMDVCGRYYFRENALKLQRLRFIDIVSLAPRDAFFKPVSWKVNTGFDREIMSDGRDQLLYRLNPGGGFAYPTSLLGISYIMVETDLNVSDKLHDDYAFGIGASAGFLKNVTERWKAGLSLLWTSYVAGDKHETIKASLLQNLKITTNNSITVSLLREKTFGYYRSEVSVLWNLYR
jgi:hypothetical protein